MPVAPSCPRCGYDLSGVAASWQETCPLDGVCSECGLSVRWAEVLNPALTVPSWSFEHAAVGRAARRLLPTWRHSLRPGRFWRTLRLEHPVAPRRLLVFLFLCLFLTHMGAYAANVWLKYDQMSAWWGGPMDFRSAAVAALWPYGFGDTMEVLTGRWVVFDEENLLGYPHFFLLAWFVLTPLSFLTLTDTLRRVRVRHVQLARAAVYSMSVFPLLTAAYVLSELLGTRALGGGFFAWYGVGFAWLDEPARWVILIGAIAWLVRSWWVIPRDYLRLPHAPGVSIAMLLVGGLAASLVTVLVIPVRLKL